MRKKYILRACVHEMANKRKLLSVEEACVIARRSIYHATFRDGASGGVGVSLADQCTTWVLMDGRNCQAMILMRLENKLENMEIVLMCNMHRC
ncbi:unnamed protein product [Brassica rapa subsp. narinosa]